MVIDVVRCTNLAMDCGSYGALLATSSYFINSTAGQYTDYITRLKTEESSIGK